MGMLNGVIPKELLDSLPEMVAHTQHMGTSLDEVKVILEEIRDQLAVLPDALAQALLASVSTSSAA